MFTNPFPNAFGLDIEDLSIKLIQLRNTSFRYHRPHYELMNHRSVDLPPGLIVNGELEKPEDLRKRLAKLLQGNSKQKTITSPWVVASLPETQSFIKLIKIKKRQDEIIDDDIILAAQRHIPSDKDNYYLQWQFIPQTGTEKTTRVLIGAVPKLISDSYTYLLESLGLGVVALEIEALSITRSLVTARKKYENEARVILDIGAARTSLIIHDHDVIQFSTSLPFSGELINTALMQKLHISYDEAEELKRSKGLDYKKTGRSAWNTIVEITDKLVDEIKSSIDFYYSHFPDANRVTRIVMGGGGANLEKLDKAISSKLKIVARPGNPWKNLYSTKNLGMSDEQSLSYATAIGLGLRAADNPFFTHDMI